MSCSKPIYDDLIFSFQLVDAVIFCLVPICFIIPVVSLPRLDECLGFFIGGTLVRLLHVASFLCKMVGLLIAWYSNMRRDPLKDHSSFFVEKFAKVAKQLFHELVGGCGVDGL